MNLVTGTDMFDAEVGVADVILVTTNSTLNRYGLVMGTGAAFQATRRCRTLPAAFGAEIRAQRAEGGRYGIIVLPPTRGAAAVTKGIGPTAWGAFQVKTDWREPAERTLIVTSVRDLADLAYHLPLWRFAVNYPGIGAGGLREEVVAPLLERLPDNVWVYRRDG